MHGGSRSRCDKPSEDISNQGSVPPDARISSKFSLCLHPPCLLRIHVILTLIGVLITVLETSFCVEEELVGQLALRLDASELNLGIDTNASLYEVTEPLELVVLYTLEQPFPRILHDFTPVNPEAFAKHIGKAHAVSAVSTHASKTSESVIIVRFVSTAWMLPENAPPYIARLERDAASYLTERCGYGHVETRLYPGRR